MLVSVCEWLLVLVLVRVIVLFLAHLKGFSGFMYAGSISVPNKKMSYKSIFYWSRSNLWAGGPAII